MGHEAADAHDGRSDGHRGRARAEVDCDEAVRQLFSYLDGELTEERRREISVHLDDCAPCARAAGFEAELRAVIASRCKDRVPQSLVERIATALAAEARRESSAGS